MDQSRTRDEKGRTPEIPQKDVPANPNPGTPNPQASASDPIQNDDFIETDPDERSREALLKTTVQNDRHGFERRDGFEEDGKHIARNKEDGPFPDESS